MYSHSYNHKSRFYRTLNISADTQKFIRDYNKAKDDVIKGKTVYFIKKKNNHKLEERK